MSVFIFVCPKCNSDDVRAIDGTYMVHSCAKCGYTGDPSQFEWGPGQPVDLTDDPLAEFFMHAEVEECDA